MIRFTLQRLKTGDQGTFGNMEVAKSPWASASFFTGECPDRGNAPMISCVLPDIYVCSIRFSDHFQRDLYHLEDKHGRTACLIHPANFMGDKAKGFKSDLEGCIALGLSQGFREGQLAILNSREALDKFMQMLAGEDFELEIKGVMA